MAERELDPVKVRELLTEVHKELGSHMFAELQTALPRYIAIVSIIATLVLTKATASDGHAPTQIWCAAMWVLVVMYLVDWHQRSIHERKKLWLRTIRTLLADSDPKKMEMETWLFMGLPFSPQDDRMGGFEKFRERLLSWRKAWYPGLDGILIYGLSVGLLIAMA